MEQTSTDGQFIIITSNDPDVFAKINPALIRTGRIDYCIKIDYCVAEQFNDICKEIYNVSYTEDELKSFPDYKYSVADVIYPLAYHHIHHNQSEKLDIKTALGVIEEYCKYSRFEAQK